MPTNEYENIELAYQAGRRDAQTFIQSVYDHGQAFSDVECGKTLLEISLEKIEKAVAADFSLETTKYLEGYFCRLGECLHQLIGRDVNLAGRITANVISMSKVRPIRRERK